MAGPYIPNNKNTLKTQFLNLAFDFLDGDLSIERDLECVGESLESLRRRMPRPTERAWSNGVSVQACSDCGRGGVPLRLHMQGGWLCALCHRELMVRLGYEDEYGRLVK